MLLCGLVSPKSNRLGQQGEDQGKVQFKPKGSLLAEFLLSGRVSVFIPVRP